jgi:hypothetical protein
LQNGGGSKSLPQLFTIPQSGNGVDPVFNTVVPCGGYGLAGAPNANGPFLLGELSRGSDEIDNGTFTVGRYDSGILDTSLGAYDPTAAAGPANAGHQLADGYYGLYAVVAIPSDAGKACSDHKEDCSWSALPQYPQEVIGIDNGVSSLTLCAIVGSGCDPTKSVPAFETNQHFLNLNITAAANQSLSELGDVECSNNGDAPNDFHPCNGTVQWPLTPGEGVKDVWIKATNGAGATKEQLLEGTVDTEAPTSSDQLIGGTEDNGWYQHDLPTVRISTTDQGNPAVGLNPAGAIIYRIDDGPEQTICPVAPGTQSATCNIPSSAFANLTDGDHTIYFTGIDAVNNRLGPDDNDGKPLGGALGMEAVSLDIDTTPPQSALLTVPVAPDGNNGWYTKRPQIVFSAVDGVGGSDVAPFFFDSGTTGGISWMLDGVIQPGSAVNSNPTTYTATDLHTVPDGHHSICWWAQDRAGNVELTGTGQPSILQLLFNGHCQIFDVDDQAMKTTIATTPGSPNGLNGWFTAGPVPVTVTASEVNPVSLLPASPISGFNLVDPADLCGAPTVPPSGASGVCVSIDNAPFAAYASGASFSIPAGTHTVRAFSVDVAGVRSPLAQRTVNVVAAPPMASALEVPYYAAQNGWWRMPAFAGHPAGSPPQLVLRAVDGDQSPGVATLQYQLNPTASSPWVTYTGPITLPEGVNHVNYRAIDNAGVVEPTQPLTLPVDQTPPTVVATSPTPVVWLQLLSVLGNLVGLSPVNAQLNWKVSDNLSPHVHITTLVFNALGAVVKQLPTQNITVTPGATVSGSTPWDGTDNTITGLVPVGLYYYRVVATDDAGNTAQSGESAPIQVTVMLPQVTVLVHVLLGGLL